MTNITEAIVFRPVDLDELRKLGKLIHRINEHECNGIDYRGMESRKLTALAKVESICAQYGYTFEHQGDPRGLALIIKYKNVEFRA